MAHTYWFVVEWMHDYLANSEVLFHTQSFSSFVSAKSTYKCKKKRKKTTDLKGKNFLCCELIGLYALRH